MMSDLTLLVIWCRLYLYMTFAVDWAFNINNHCYYFFCVIFVAWINSLMTYTRIQEYLFVSDIKLCRKICCGDVPFIQCTNKKTKHYDCSLRTSKINQPFFDKWLKMLQNKTCSLVFSGDISGDQKLSDEDMEKLKATTLSLYLKVRQSLHIQLLQEDRTKLSHPVRA